MRFLTTLLLVTGSVFVLPAQKYTITTVVGSTSSLGDGGIASLAGLIQPVAVVADAAGNIYISDQVNSRIRKIDGITGIISTLTTVPTAPAGLAVDRTGAYLYVADDTAHRVRRVNTKTGATTSFAGAGSGGFSGDGHPAINARLRNPKAVWVDDDNNVFIADTKNNRIRRVDASTGEIRTIAGKGGQNSTVSTPAGTAALAVNNVAGDGGRATQAQLANPEGVTGDDSGNIYIADTNYHRIRKVDSSGRITTVAGRGTPGVSDGVDAMQAELNAPRGLAFDSKGNLFIADSTNNRIRELMVKTSILRTVAGAGSAGDEKQAQIASLSFPSGIDFDANGDLLIADQNNGRIRRVDSKSGLIYSLTGTVRAPGAGGLASSANLSDPGGVAVDSAGNLYASDSRNHKVFKVSMAGGVLSTVVGTGLTGNGPTGNALLARINYPGCLAVDSSSNVFVADRVNSKIRKVDATSVMSNVAGADSVTVDKKGKVTYTAMGGYNGDGSAAVIARPNLTAGNGILSAGKSSNANGPNCVSVDSNDNLYVADTGNNVIRKIDPSGIITTVVGYATPVPDSNGVPVNTGVAGSAGDGGMATEAQLNHPQGVGVDSGGNQLCIADTGNHTVRQVDLRSRTIVTIAGITSDGGSDKNLPGPGYLSRLNGPEGCAVDANGSTFIADSKNNRIVKVDSDGTMTMIAGGGSTFGSDGKPATDAQLFLPSAISVDGKGNVYFTDRFGLIKKLTLAK